MSAVPVSSVRIVGVGLLGTSIGLALRQHGVDVMLDDASPTNVRIAADYGAGRPAGEREQPELIFVCVPPDVTAQVVEAELALHPRATVVDVASVKSSIVQALQASGADLSRYIPSHPMAGRERGGPSAGRADLFTGRPWVVCWHAGAVSSAPLEAIIRLLGAQPVSLSAEDHDRAVALVSHVPQLVSSLMARRLGEARPADVQLAGQGVRDVTRIAASDPDLWVQILGANAGAVRDVLAEIAGDLHRIVRALDDVEAPGARRALAEALEAGNIGVRALPGKHGGASRFTTLTVLVDDEPGQLARLLAEVGDIGVNLEDL
ncbi:MAG TPA: prephenate dehydrogenase, partial [Microbacteriaceae bacterium]|nr:prephenate dehydrogenase [Microbacteriaceae bacterium]